MKFISRNIKLYFLIITGLITSSCIAQKNEQTIIFSDSNQIIDISSNLLIYEDKTQKLSLNNVKDKKFNAFSSNVPNLGISKSVFWVKITIKNTSNSHNLLLDLALPTLDNVVFYYPEDNETYGSKIISEEVSFSNRQYKDPNYLFDLDLKKEEIKTYFLKINSSEGIQLPIKIATKETIFNQIKKRDILSGIYFGVMLVMILYNLFIYFSVRDKSYIYYVIYILLILLTQTSLQGYPFQYLWPNIPQIAKNSLFIFPSLVSIAGIMFMKVFLKTNYYTPVLSKFSYLFYFSYSISIIFALITQYKISFIIMEISSMIVSFYMLYTAIVVLKKGYQPAKYFLAAWSIFLIGVVIYILKDFEVLPFNNFTRYTMHIGSGIETVLLSFALAARINVYKKERLEALKEKERVVREQNIILEEKVKERTKELNQVLTNLKQTQSQLVDAEKMSSLGQLTAGIAHEINNPINFVSSSISPLRRDIKDIESIIKKYEEINVSDNLEEKLKEVEALKQEIDYEYIKAELETIINSIQDGAERTKEIVSSLRNFSRLDEIDLQKADINEGIESTLVLLKNKLNGITLSKDLGKLPIIECYPSKLNQAFMNVIDNAIGAVKEKNLKSGKGSIEIKTHFDDDFIYINIKDNGVGIDEKIKEKIFEPFFTTKDVGKGTGLGLSIVYSIIESHKGDIIVNSKKNEGSEFIIKIPNRRG